MSACVRTYTCRLASKEAELQKVEKLLLGIFGVPLQEQKQLMHDMLKTMTMLQSKIVITYVFLVPVYWLPMLQKHRFMFICLCTEAQRTTIDAWKSQFQVRSLADCYLWKYKTNRWRSHILEARKRYSSMVTCMFTVVNVCAFQHVQTEPFDSCQDMCVCPGKMWSVWTWQCSRKDAWHTRHTCILIHLPPIVLAQACWETSWRIIWRSHISGHCNTDTSLNYG